MPCQFAPVALALILAFSGQERSALQGTVVGPKGAPVQGATVFIYTAGPRVGTSPFCPSCYLDCRKSALTDAAGAFEISDLDAALIFRILAVAEGCEPQFVAGVDPAQGPVRIALAPRRAAADSECALRGRVLGADGEPVVGATISPLGMKVGDQHQWGGLDAVDPLAVSDGKGEFTIHSREPADAFDVRVDARGLAIRVWSLLETGSKEHELALARGATVTGRLMKDGRPVPAVAVGLVQTSRRPALFVGDYVIGTDEGGHFEFTNVAAEQPYYLYGKMDSLKDLGAVRVREIAVGKDESTLDVGDVEVEAGLRLSGTVLLSDGKSLPATTRIQIGSTRAWDSQILEIGADGSFGFENLPSDQYTVGLRVRDYRLSDHNYSLDALNGFLMGVLESDTDDLTILLEPGNRAAALTTSSDLKAQLERQSKPLLGISPEEAAALRAAKGSK
jgi:hypothetical protein